MPKFVDADKLMESLSRKKSGIANQRYTEGFNDALMRFRSMLHSETAVDVVEVVHGRWEEYDQYVCDSDDKPVAKIGTIFVCSQCGREENHRQPYCHCGAKMDGDKDA